MTFTVVDKIGFADRKKVGVTVSDVVNIVDVNDGLYGTFIVCTVVEIVSAIDGLLVGFTDVIDGVFIGCVVCDVVKEINVIDG